MGIGAAVLILEDEEIIADLLKERLDDAGYKVNVAYTGSEALMRLKQQSPDIITLDLHLPDANGLEILKDLKSDPQTSRIPVVIISSSEEGEKAREYGAAEFIRKPIDFRKLFSVLQTARARRQEAPEA